MPVINDTLGAELSNLVKIVKKDSLNQGIGSKAARPSQTYQGGPLYYCSVLK